VVRADTFPCSATALRVAIALVCCSPSKITHLAPMTPHMLTRTPLYVALCSNTYSALNALAGHYNSFGATAPIPKKRLERLTKVRRHGLTDQWFWRGGEKGGRRQQLGVLWHCKHS
jgi:hypothetical protein